MLQKNCHVWIISLSLGVPWWGAIQSKKTKGLCPTLGLPRYRSVILVGGIQSKKMYGALPYLGITSLSLGDPWWGGHSKQKNIGA
ncbi:MAG: hypothetical protein A2X20_06120 [Bacteroidetes bacterium GWE2_40_15]|nr:MAG: hypothetical protein A2X20_06120 [Bacteroidetes bacterium GWE2_40_15]